MQSLVHFGGNDVELNARGKRSFPCIGCVCLMSETRAAWIDHQHFVLHHAASRRSRL